MTTDWTTVTAADWASRPRLSAPRQTGVASRFSITPRSMSSMNVMPVQPADMRAVSTTTPGVR